MPDALKVSVLVKDHELLSRTFATARIVIGREADCDLRLNQADVSRHHACIVKKDPYGYLLLDLGSSNGTFVNEESVSLIPIRDGAHARITTFDLAFQLVDVPWEKDDEPESPVPGSEDQVTLLADAEADPKTSLSSAEPKTRSRKRSLLGSLSAAVSSRRQSASD